MVSFSRIQSIYSLLAIGFLVLGINVAVDWYNTQSFQLDLNQRIIATALALIPLGIFMGMPFPYGMSQLRGKHVAVCWGLNGILTVVGSINCGRFIICMGVFCNNDNRSRVIRFSLRHPAETQVLIHI